MQPLHDLDKCTDDKMAVISTTKQTCHEAMNHNKMKIVTQDDPVKQHKHNWLHFVFKMLLSMLFFLDDCKSLNSQLSTLLTVNSFSSDSKCNLLNYTTLHFTPPTLPSTLALSLIDWIEQGLTSHQTHYRSYRGRVFMGQITKPTVSEAKDQASIPSGPPHRAYNNKTYMQYAQ